MNQTPHSVLDVKTVISGRLQVACMETPSFSPLAATLRRALDGGIGMTTRSKGKIMKALDDHLIQSNDEKMRRKCLHTMNEIVTSEKTYLEQLAKITKFFLDPIERKNLIPRNTTSAIFSNVTSIYNLNSKLFGRFEIDSPDTIVDAFIEMAPFLKQHYSAFAYNFKNAVETLEKMLKSRTLASDYIKKQETRPEVCMKLQSLLITPIQRVPRYLLLLKDLQSATPETSNVYAKIETAIDQISKVADHIDNLVGEQEMSSRMLRIQKSLVGRKPNIMAPGRKLIKEGLLKKVGNGSKSSEKYLILFTDMILYCKCWHGCSSLKCSKFFPLKKTFAHSNVSRPDIFFIESGSISLALKCDKDGEAKQWVDVIQKTIRNLLADLKTLQRKESCRKALKRKHFDQLPDASSIPAKKVFRFCTLKNETTR